MAKQVLLTSEGLKKLQDERLIWQVKRMYENVELFRKIFLSSDLFKCCAI